MNNENIIVKGNRDQGSGKPENRNEIGYDSD